MKKSIRAISLILALAIVLCLSACGVTTNTPIGSESSKSESKDVGEEKIDIQISEQLLFEKEGIKVTAKGFKKDDIFGDGVSLLIENNGKKSVGIGVEYLVVNGYMITDLFSETVDAGMKSNKTLNLPSSELDKAGIENIGLIELAFKVYDPDTYKDIFTTNAIEIKTNAYDTMKIVKQDEGKELVNRDGIRIVGKFVEEDTIWGTAVVLFIENTGKNDVTITAEDVAVNGFMVTSAMYANVMAGKMVIGEITILSSSLEENGITDIEEITFKFKAHETKTYDDIFKTDKLTVNPAQ